MAVMSRFSRREFLRIAGLTLGTLAFTPLTLPPGDSPDGQSLARATRFGIGVLDNPDPEAPLVRRLSRDEVVPVREEVIGPNGPSGNPRWFHLADGFAHTAYLQPVRDILNPPLGAIDAPGRLAEVTVPYTQSYEQANLSSRPLYRLYCSAVFWVVGVVQGVDGEPWYTLLDERLYKRSYVHAKYLRVFELAELEPLSPEIPLEQKRIEVDLAQQRLTAFESGRAVFATTISGGRYRANPSVREGKTWTPIGQFAVFQKIPSRHMGDGRLTSDIEANEFPGVPWVSLFTMAGIAFHGVYWHNDFGRPRSDGCINMRPAEALWVYRWARPIVPLTFYSEQRLGTQVEVRG
jgi:lipoprotein-anchoring transpeptidase ErfK/SrfK